jgi:hypothetical protein
MTPQPAAISGAISRLAFTSALLQEQLRSLDQVYDQGLDLLGSGHGICRVLGDVPIESRLHALDGAFTDFFVARRERRRVVIAAAVSDGADIVELANYFAITPGLVASFSFAQGGDGGHH